MIDKACIVCQDTPALHTITLTRNDHVITHYLCSYHYRSIDDPKRFFSLLDDITIPQEQIYDISEFMTD